MTDNADIMLDMERNDTADINEYLVNNGIAVLGIEAKRSLEEYFLSITKHSGHG